MINAGPYILGALGTSVTAHNPLSRGGNNPVAVQISNLSSNVLEASAGGLIYLVQSFTALTVPLSADGADLSVENYSAPFTVSTGSSFTVTWLLQGEQSPQVDGPLTAAAIAASIAYGETLIASQTTATKSVTVTLPPGTVALRILTPGTPGGPLTITGVTTGIQYGPVIQNYGTFYIFTVQVDGAADSQVTVAFTYYNAANWYVVAVNAPIVTTPTPPNMTGGGGVTYWEVVGGTTSTGSAPLLVTNNGNLVPLVPTAVATRLTAGQILAAPTSGGNYLFGFNMAGNVAGGSVCTLTDSGTLDVAMGFVSSGANTIGQTFPLFGYRTTTAVTLTVFGNALSGGNLLYAPGP